MVKVKRRKGEAEADPNRKVKSDILYRVNMLYVIFFIAAVIITTRIVYVQYFSSEVAGNASKIHDRIFRQQTIKAHRGSILDRNGEPLATSILRYQVEMDFGSEGFDSLRTFYTQSDSLAKLLSAYFKDRSAGEYRQLFRNGRANNYKLTYRKDTLVMRSAGWFDRLTDMLRGESMVTVKLYDTLRNHRGVAIFPRVVDYAEWQVLKEYPILNWNMGMTYNLVDKEERVYTQGGIAQRTLGAIREDRGNDYGIEAIYNKQLSGEDGEVLRQRIAPGFYGRVVGGDSRDAVAGMDVVTTIDAEIQDFTSAALLKQVKANRAIWGTAMVMEVATGDLVAIANYDRLSNGEYAEQRNRAIGARSEPGSTMKLASTMALLEVAKMPTSTIIDSENGDRVKVGNAWVQDSHKEGNEVDLRTAFTKSLNVYFAKAIYENFKDDPNRYTDFLKSLHLDRAMGLEDYGELTPRLPTQGSALWTPHQTIVNLGYGYSIELSPVQTLTLYNAVANNGRMVAPKLVKEIRNDDRVVESFPTKVLVDKVCSQPVLDTLRSFLHGVCQSGTAQWYLGRFDGFEVAGKTGTAQFAQDGYQYRDGIYNGTMVGYIPAQNPKYTVIALLQVKRGMARSIYGAGLGGPVVQEIMQKLYNREHQWHTKLDTIRKVNSPVKVKSSDLQLSQIEEGVVPSFYGMGLRDAVFLSESIGLKVSVVGKGSIYRQSIKAGTKYKQGESITLTLR
ncbi:MAG: penicillin-binding transpeptidase domain-containing protein [Rikenellaceae bacterium]